MRYVVSRQNFTAPHRTGRPGQTAPARLAHMTRSTVAVVTVSRAIGCARYKADMMESSPSREKENDQSRSSSESPPSRGQPPYNQYHVYNFGEAAGNTLGSPAYYYQGYPADYYYPGYYCSGSQRYSGNTVSRPASEVRKLTCPLL